MHQQGMAYLLLHFGQGDLFIPLVLLPIFQGLVQTGDGLLDFPLLSVDSLHVSRSELLVLQLDLQGVPLMF